MTTDPLLRVEQELGLFMRRARAASAHLARDIHPDLDAGAYTLLTTVAATPGIRASDLAGHLGVGRGTMSRQLARLEHLGLIARGTDPLDSRNHPLGLTEEGARRLAHAKKARHAFFATSLGHWGEPDLAALADLLGRLNTDIGRLPR